MSFVPIITPTHVPQPPSPRARELARKLSESIEKYRREHRNTTDLDIDQALRLVAPRKSIPGGPLLVALIAGVLLALGLALFLYAR